MSYNPFKKASPVWPSQLETEKNITIGLYTSVNIDENATLHIATSGFYRVFCNNKFLYYGPARCAHNFFRVDEIPIPCGITHIAIEIVNYFVNSFDYICQPGFVQAELTAGDRILCATGLDGFNSLLLTERIRRVQRYSFQRPFAESYRLTPDYDSWQLGVACGNALPIVLSQVEEKKLLPRRIPLNSFPTTFFNFKNAHGTFRDNVKPQNYIRDRSLLYIDDPNHNKLGGYKQEVLEVHLSDLCQELKNIDFNNDSTTYNGTSILSKGQFEIISLPGERTGFITINICCNQAGIILFMFDEVLNNSGDVNPLRMDCCNIIQLEMQPGSYNFRTIEPYGLQYCKIVVISGSFSLENAGICEYICPVPTLNDLKFDDPQLAVIYQAARQTFVQNSSDLFMDCPTRERAGWLCDSFFTARAEKTFTGKNIIEYNFLENFILPKTFPIVPDGMLPMCYPSDHYDSCFIPNWGLWFILELEDRFDRVGDTKFILSFRKRVYDLLEWFKSYENTDGLLEKLPGWIFIEWSKANDFTQDINFPTNMLYARALESASRIFKDKSLYQKSYKLKEIIRSRSFDGTFFTDNEVYCNMSTLSSHEHTETCQYYAFFTGIATPESHPELWHILTSEFGPTRVKHGIRPEIYPSNAFIGNFLRLLLLERYGLYGQLLSEIKSYFYYMAVRTGTLWENTTDLASCNHGFASYVATMIINAKKK